MAEFTCDTAAYTAASINFASDHKTYADAGPRPYKE
jgi:hypothetical protein